MKAASPFHRFVLAVVPVGVLVLTGQSPFSPPLNAPGRTIVFGAAVSLTGREAREGRLTQEGYDFWKDYVNAHGGIRVGTSTYRVDVKYYDDQTSPQTAARLVERLVRTDRVDFILGPYGSPSSFASAAVAERSKVPMVEGNGAAERIFDQGYRFTFAVLSPARRYLEGVVDLARHMQPPAKTMAIAAADDAFSVEVQQGAVDFASTHGIKVLYAAKYASDTTDVSGIVSAIKATRADIILSAGHLQDALLIQRGLKEQNVLAKLYAYSVGPDTPDFRESLGRDADYVFGGAQWSPTVRYRGAPGFYRTAPEYAAAFTKQYGHIPDYHNADASAACLAFQYAIERAGSLEPRRVRDALAALNVTTFYGVLRFDARGLNMYKPMVVNQVQRGRLVTVWPAGVADAKPEYPAPAWAYR